MGGGGPEVKQTAEPARRQERMLRRAEQLAGMGSWHWEIGTNTLIWSDELCRIYGLEPGTALSYEVFINRIHPDDRARVHAAVAAALESGKPFRHQERIIRPDGQMRVLDSQAEVERDEAGRPVSMFGLCRDITEEVRSRDALLERERRFAKLFHASPVATALTTLAEGRFVDVNARFLDITGYSREELLGLAPQVLRLWSPPEDREGFLARLREAGTLRESTVSYLDRTGNERRALAAVELVEIDGEDCLLTLLWRT